jgi:hypothetical protein
MENIFLLVLIKKKKKHKQNQELVRIATLALWNSCRIKINI